MFERLKYFWIPRLCFVLTVTLAAGVALTVGVAPWFIERDLPPASKRLFEVFAHEVLVRRTALVCVVGLVVTACVFFRVTPPPAPPPKKKRPRSPAPHHIPGA